MHMHDAVDTKLCSDDEFYKTTDKLMKAIYEANNKKFQFLMMSCSGIAFGLVKQARTATLKDGEAYLFEKPMRSQFTTGSLGVHLIIRIFQ